MKYQASPLHKTWLLVSSAIILGLAPIFFLATLPQGSGLATAMIDLADWPLDGGSVFAGSELRFVSALTSGFMAGWGITVLLLSVWVYDQAPEAVRKTVLTGMLAWFATDSAGSVLSGYPVNALFNIGFLLLAVGPLWWPAKAGKA
jgi:hypothetical protein